MSKRSDARHSEEGGAVRVLAPDPDPRRARPVEMTSSTQSPSSAAALAVAAVVGILGVAAFLVLMGDTPIDEVPPSATNQPTPFAAPEPAVPGRTIDVTSSWAAGAGIAGGAEVADAVVGQARLVAAGAAGSRAAVWASTIGNEWDPAAYVETPAGSTSRFERIAVGNGGWIGVGAVDGEPAVWRAEEWENWEYLGRPPSLAGLEDIVGVTVGPGDQYWLVGSDANGPMLWTSSDGSRWIKHDPGLEPAEIVVNTVAAEEDDGGWLYLAGSRCRDTACRPALWKTQDGTSWIDAETAVGLSGGELSADSGAVATLSVAANRIVAAGSSDVSGFSMPVVWISRDGVTWAASGLATLGFPAVNIRLQGVSDTEPGVASLTVAGRAADVTAGDTLVTELGVVVIANVDRPRVTLRFGSEEIDLGTGSSVALRVNRGIESVAVQADRIVAVGFESDRSGANPAPVAWISADGGSVWEMHRLPGRGYLPASVGLYGRRVIAVSAGGESWHHDWDGSVAAAAAAEVVGRLVASVAKGNLAEVIATLPETRSELHGHVEFPGLTDVRSALWDESSEFLDPFFLAGALAFVTELDTTVRVFDCSATQMWGLGVIRVNCHFRITSDFLRSMGFPEDGGRLSALVAEGVVVSMTSSGTESAWQELEQWARNTDPEAASLVFGAEDGGTPPQIDAAFAEASLAWVQRYRDAFLLPGDSVEVATPVGNMTWSVIDPFGGQMVEGVVFAQGAFWALAAESGLDFEFENRMLWRSEDGMAWEAVGELPTEDWWRLIAGSDRLFVIGGGDEAPTLWEWNGTVWAEFEIAIPDAGNWWLQSIAESNGQVLVLGEGWEWPGDRPLGGALWSQGSGGVFDVVAVDGPDLSLEALRSLIAVDSGFVLFVSSTEWIGSETEVWSSQDGATWELLTDEPGFAGGWLPWVGTVGGDLVVIAWGGDDCPSTGEPCRPVWQQWRSADGIDWELVGAMNLDGALAGGTLGLVAIGQDGWWGAPQSMSVFMTDRAGQFVELADVEVRFPGADWNWPGEIAMSDTAIVAPINGGFESGFVDGRAGELEDSWLLVGRVLEP